MNARQEANERVGGAYDARVLEPSPPAVTDPPWNADDPVNDGDRAAPGSPVLSPVTGSGRTWDELCRDQPELAGWCAERWLGVWRPLPPIPDGARYDVTRRSLHALAEHLLSPARHAANGKIGLRFTRNGFGTPFFPGPTGGDEQLRVAGTDLVVDRGDEEHRTPITTIRAAAEFANCAAGAPAGATILEAGVTGIYEPETPFEPDAPLTVDPAVSAFLGDWFGMAASVLEQLRAEADPADAPARVQLWPEHFDPAVDIGNEAAAGRGTFGASPGDEEHPEPYLYVTHWAEVPDDPFWNDAAFGGASLPLRTLVQADDQRATALDFFRAGRRVLSGR